MRSVGTALLTAVLISGQVCTVALAQKPVHVPSERELNKEITGVKTDSLRGYQQRSVEEAQSWTRRTIDWIKGILMRIHLTPARLALGLGVVGSIYTAGKNKRKVNWAVISALSYILLIVGACAMYFDWPYMN